MPESGEIERIPKAFTDALKQRHGSQFEATSACVQLSAKILAIKPANSLQRLTRFFLASMTNSITALGVICRYGHGADAIRIARGMFEILVSMKYLIARPDEVADYLDFDWIARWKRMQFYKAHYEKQHKQFSAEKREEVEREYARVRDRFVGCNGKVRSTWCKHPISQMAEVADLGELYQLFYPYSSAIHHASPMGLGMLMDGTALDVLPAPKLAHIGVALMLAVTVHVETIRSHSKLLGTDCEEILKVIQDTVGKDNIEDENVVSSLADVFPDDD